MKAVKATVAGSLAVLTALTATACTSAGGSSKDTLSVVAFSVMESANVPAFEAFQDTDAGENTDFAPSYGAWALPTGSTTSRPTTSSWASWGR
jgi:hypothetical protein